MQKERIHSLDVLRIFACLCILTIHFNASMSGYSYGGFIYPNSITPNFFVESRLYLGDIGVSIFFMLTGASLYISTRKWHGVKNFYFKRFKSIFPCYWLMYVIATMIDFIRNKMWIVGNIKYLFASIFGMDGYIGLFYSDFYVTYKIGEWFLGCLIIIYLIYPCLLWMFDRKPIITSISILLLYFVYQILAENYSLPDSTVLFYLRLPEIIIGMLYIKYFINCKKMFVALSSFIIFGLAYLFRDYISNMTLCLAFCIFISIVIILIGEKIKYRAMLSVINKIARLTYPAFLVHHWLLGYLLIGFDLSTMNRSNIYLMFVVYVVLVFLLSKHLFEKATNITNFLGDFCNMRNDYNENK